jgi:hypothetical protein
MTVSLQTDASREEKVVRLGLLLPITGWTAGRTILGAATLAINEINSHPNGLMQGRRVEFVYEDDGCSPMLGTTALSRLLEAKATKPIHAVIGASCNAACLPSGFLAAGSDLPQVSYGCSSGTRTPSSCVPLAPALKRPPYNRSADASPRHRFVLRFLQTCCPTKSTTRLLSELSLRSLSSSLRLPV